MKRLLVAEYSLHLLVADIEVVAVVVKKWSITLRKTLCEYWNFTRLQGGTTWAHHAGCSKRLFSKAAAHYHSI
jgi:hypothetical protein